MNEGHVQSTEGREHVGHSPVSCTVLVLAFGSVHVEQTILSYLTLTSTRSRL
jgi:hypothetical protein